MGAFRYQAIDAEGKRVNGVMESDSERQVRARLRDQRLRPLDVVAANDTGHSSAGVGFFASFAIRTRRLPVAELSLISRQLASLVQSGLPLDEALQICARQSRRLRVKTLLSQVRSRVMEGNTLAQAMAEHPGAFDRMYCAMVRAGESAGYLGEVLERLAEYTENGQQTRQKLQMALMYPLVLLGVSVLVVALLMTFVVPRLVSMFATSSRDLPMLTKMLIASSDFMGSVWALLLVAVLIGAVLWFKWWLREVDNRRRWHTLLLKIPLLNEILVQADSSRFASTLAILLASGVPLLDAVKIAAQVLNNEVMRTAAGQLAINVQEGASFSKSLQQSDVFPALLVQMAANGEANGTLAKQLAYAAANQERELSMRLGTAMALLEPLTIVLMGGLVTLIMLAVLLPIFDINTLI